MPNPNGCDHCVVGEQLVEFSRTLSSESKGRAIGRALAGDFTDIWYSMVDKVPLRHNSVVATERGLTKA